jgi:hypothetical protein
VRVLSPAFFLRKEQASEDADQSNECDDHGMVVFHLLSQNHTCTYVHVRLHSWIWHRHNLQVVIHMSKNANSTSAESLSLWRKIERREKLTNEEKQYLAQGATQTIAFLSTLSKRRYKDTIKDMTEIITKFGIPDFAGVMPNLLVPISPISAPFDLHEKLSDEEREEMLALSRAQLFGTRTE